MGRNKLHYVPPVIDHELSTVYTDCMAFVCMPAPKYLKS